MRIPNDKKYTILLPMIAGTVMLFGLLLNVLFPGSVKCDFVCYSPGYGLLYWINIIGLPVAGILIVLFKVLGLNILDSVGGYIVSSCSLLLYFVIGKLIDRKRMRRTATAPTDARIGALSEPAAEQRDQAVIEDVVKGSLQPARLRYRVILPLAAALVYAIEWFIHILLPVSLFSTLISWVLSLISLPTAPIRILLMLMFPPNSVGSMISALVTIVFYAFIGSLIDRQKRISS